MRKAEVKMKWEEFQETMEMPGERSKVGRWMGSRTETDKERVGGEIGSGQKSSSYERGDDNSTAKVFC